MAGKETPAQSTAIKKIVNNKPLPLTKRLAANILTEYHKNVKSYDSLYYEVLPRATSKTRAGRPAAPVDRKFQCNICATRSDETCMAIFEGGSAREETCLHLRDYHGEEAPWLNHVHVLLEIEKAYKKQLRKEVSQLATTEIIVEQKSRQTPTTLVDFINAAEDTSNDTENIVKKEPSIELESPAIDIFVTKRAQVVTEVAESQRRKKPSDRQFLKYVCQGESCKYTSSGQSGSHWMKKHCLKAHGTYRVRFVAKDYQSCQFVLEENAKVVGSPGQVVDGELDRSCEMVKFEVPEKPKDSPCENGIVRKVEKAAGMLMKAHQCSYCKKVFTGQRAATKLTQHTRLDSGEHRCLELEKIVRERNHASIDETIDRVCEMAKTAPDLLSITPTDQEYSDLLQLEDPEQIRDSSREMVVT